MYPFIARFKYPLAMAIALITAIVLFASITVERAQAVTPPVLAQKAKAYGTVVSHASDDSGYAAMIHVLCNNGKHVWLKPGQRTLLGTTEAEGCSMSGVDRIIVGWDQTVYCKNYSPPYENRYFYTGEANDAGTYRTWKCYMQRPL